MSRWDELGAASRSFGERADCSVRALAVATGLSYELCHKALALHGRKPRGGAWPDEVQRAAESLGFRTETRRRFECKTIAKVADHCRVGVGAVIFATRHFAGWNGAEVIDWSAGSRKRVNYIIDIFEKE